MHLNFSLIDFSNIIDKKEILLEASYIKFPKKCI